MLSDVVNLHPYTEGDAAFIPLLTEVSHPGLGGGRRCKLTVYV